MEAVRQIQSRQKPAPPNVLSRSDAFFNDLGLLISVAIARLVVWRILRRRSRERAERLRRFKLIQGSNDHIGKCAITS